MTWDDTQSASTSISSAEWNNMVTFIKQWPRTAYSSGDTETLTLSQTLISCDTTGGAITLTLPEAADSLGKLYLVMLETDTGTDVTLTCTGDDVLNAATNTIATLADVEDWLFIVAISNDRWLIIADNGVAYS